jgi:hypothetical protein
MELLYLNLEWLRGIPDGRDQNKSSSQKRRDIVLSLYVPGVDDRWLSHADDDYERA